MADAADCVGPGAVSNVGDSILQRSRRRQRNTNTGYVLFVFGAIWIMAIAGMMAAAPSSWPNVGWPSAGLIF